MIENPKVGKRVWLMQPLSFREITIDAVYGSRLWNDDFGTVYSDELYDSPYAAAAALRTQAAELNAAADRLEQEDSE